MADQNGQLLIFDADDTLWETEVLYDEARERAANLVARAGLDRGRWTELQKAIDIENVKTMGLSRRRFPTSSVQAYERLAGTSVLEPLRDRIWSASETVFTAPARPLPGVAETLVRLADAHTLVMLTKGDREVQQMRIDRFEHVGLFDALIVVPRKTASTFESIVDIYGGDSARSWSIGNSLASDIIPAAEAGLKTIWIDAYVWGHELRQAGDVPDATVVLDDFGGVLDVIDKC